VVAARFCCGRSWRCCLIARMNKQQQSHQYQPPSGCSTSGDGELAGTVPALGSPGCNPRARATSATTDSSTARGGALLLLECSCSRNRRGSGGDETAFHKRVADPETARPKRCYNSTRATERKHGSRELPPVTNPQSGQARPGDGCQRSLAT
jgi:hypothetical protein